jgi:hypothetical protein
VLVPGSQGGRATGVCGQQFDRRASREDYAARQAGRRRWNCGSRRRLQQHRRAGRRRPPGFPDPREGEEVHLAVAVEVAGGDGGRVEVRERREADRSKPPGAVAERARDQASAPSATATSSLASPLKSARARLPPRTAAGGPTARKAPVPFPSSASVCFPTTATRSVLPSPLTSPTPRGPGWRAATIVRRGAKPPDLGCGEIPVSRHR